MQFQSVRKLDQDLAIGSTSVPGSSAKNGSPPRPMPLALKENMDSTSPRRADLHCHSDASNKAGEAVLNAIKCPECYSSPCDVYAQAKRREMDFVTITDHDSLAGVSTLAGRDDVLSGEELTCYFPEDGCKMHVLVYGIDQADHDALQSRAADIYDVAEYIEKNNIAHSVAHPIYRQNDKLERWHVERLILMFKGFECLNGAHSPLHRDAFEPLLNRLTRQEIAKLAERHGMLPRWPEPWFKARTGGSDDHGLLNIGRTWTEFPPDTRTAADALQCLREGTCRPGGEAGSSVKLAHNFYSVGVRYYSRHIMSPGQAPNLATTLLQMFVGERAKPGKTELARMVFRHRVRNWAKQLKSKLSRKSTFDSSVTANRRVLDNTIPNQHIDGTGLLKLLFLNSAKARIDQHPDLLAALDKGLPPLGEHGAMFDFVSAINRDVSHGIAKNMTDSLDDASFTGLFDSISAILAQQFVLLPYYFAVFHQNKERHLLRKLTGTDQPKTSRDLKVGLFTDTLDDINGVARFIGDMAAQAHAQQRHFIVHTCGDESRVELPGATRKNFTPLLTREMPYYSNLKLTLPPLLEVLEWADRQQFDAIHVSTPGPMGLCGWVVSQMLRVPLIGTYHTDFPKYIDQLTHDHRVTSGTVAYMKWFYEQTQTVFSRSKEYRFALHDLGVTDDRIRGILPGIDTTKFKPENRDVNVWQTLGVTESRKLFYAGRVSVEKNLPLMVEAFKMLRKIRGDVALVVAGDGPYLQKMKQDLAGHPVYFLGVQGDESLGRLYASSDVFVFPSRTDTLGQVVMEAQASGLPVLVSNEGGPKEMTDDGLTGLVLPAVDPWVWCRAIDDLLADEPRRHRMARTAPQRVRRFSLEKTF